MIAILVIIILSLLLVGACYMWYKSGKKNREIEKVAEVLTDHTIQDQEIRRKQQVVKRKIIEAQNEKDSDEVINHMRDIFNNSKL